VTRLATLLMLMFGATLVSAADAPCQSGLTPGQRPGPYAFLVAWGEQRGKSHCFVCETGDKPAIIIFARTPNDPLARLHARINQAVIDHKKSDLRAWTTFLSDNQPALEPKLVEWARRHGLSNIAIGVFEDLDGPPSYRLSREADVTVLLSVNQKVVANFAFRQGELNDEKIKAIVEAFPKIVGK
jgi:hypothetical protein